MLNKTKLDLCRFSLCFGLPGYYLFIFSFGAFTGHLKFLFHMVAFLPDSGLPTGGKTRRATAFASFFFTFRWFLFLVFLEVCHLRPRRLTSTACFAVGCAVLLRCIYAPWFRTFPIHTVKKKTRKRRQKRNYADRTFICVCNTQIYRECFFFCFFVV